MNFVDMLVWIIPTLLVSIYIAYRQSKNESRENQSVGQEQQKNDSLINHSPTNKPLTNNLLRIDGKILYTFDHNIQEIVEFDSLFFVLLENNWKEVFNQNLLCISNEGKLIWRCEDMLAGRNPESSVPPYAHYTNIWMKGDQLWGSNYFGTHENLLDIRTGKILESYYSK